MNLPIPSVNGLVSFKRDQILDSTQKTRVHNNIGTLSLVQTQLQGYIPYTGATQSLDMGLYDVQATRFKFGSTGPQLDNSGDTIRARTNNGLADAPISASSLTVSGSISHASAGLDLKAASGWVTLYDGLNCTFGARSNYGAVVFNGNRLGFDSGSVGIADAYLGRSQANELAVYIDRQTVSNTLGNFKAANVTASGQINFGTSGPKLKPSSGTLLVRNPTDTANGDMSLGSLTASGTILAGIYNNGFGGGGISIGWTGVTSGMIAGGQFNLYESGISKMSIVDTQGFNVSSDRGFYFSSTTASSGTKDTSITRASANTVQIGNGAANALGSLACANVTASGIVSCGTYVTAPAGFYSVASGGNAMGYDFDFSTSLKKHVLTGQLGAVFLGFGGSTSSFPALRRNAAVLESKLADDSGFAAIRSGFISLSADPTTLDLTSGGSALYKNTTSGALKLWVNDGGTMKSVALT